MNENVGQEMPSREDAPRTTAVREREVPRVTIVRVGVHYVVHAGCKTMVLHRSEEVFDYLESLLKEWVRDNLTDVNEVESAGPELKAVLYRERI